VIESDAPLQVESEVFQSNGVPRGWQVVEIARDWIAGGQTSTIPRVLPLFDNSPINLFLINPNTFDVRFEYWTAFGSRSETLVAAKRVALVTLPHSFLCTSCGGAEQPTGFGFPVQVRAPFPYLAAISTRSRELPPIVRVARSAE